MSATYGTCYFPAPPDLQQSPDGASPDTITMLEFQTVEDTRRAQTSEQLQKVLDGLRSVGVTAQVLLVERSPFTPEPIPA
jgi:hypothetical protein